jgi:hypothetical protein
MDVAGCSFSYLAISIAVAVWVLISGGMHFFNMFVLAKVGRRNRAATAGSLAGA